MASYTESARFMVEAGQAKREIRELSKLLTQLNRTARQFKSTRINFNVNTQQLTNAQNMLRRLHTLGQWPIRQQIGVGAGGLGGGGGLGGRGGAAAAGMGGFTRSVRGATSSLANLAAVSLKLSVVYAGL